MARDLLQEIANQIFEDLRFNAPGEWSREHGLSLKQFEIDGDEYELQCSEQNSQNEELIHVSFVHIDKSGNRSAKLRDADVSPKSTLKLMATIINSTLQRFPKATVFVFTAKQGQESFYRALIRRASSALGGSNADKTGAGGTAFFVMKPESKFDFTKYNG